MLDIQQIVNDKVKELIEDKTIENSIKSNIEKTIDEEIKRIFNGYEFSESIRKLIKDQIGDIGSTIKLNSYNSLIINTIEDLLNSKVTADLKDKIKSVVENQFFVTEKEIKLSDVVNAIKDNMDSDDEDEWNYSVSIESYQSFIGSIFNRKKISFFFNEEDDSDKNIVITLVDNLEHTIFHIENIEYKNFEIQKIQTLRTYDKLECLLIKAYLNRLPFVIDMTEEECENELYKTTDY